MRVDVPTPDDPLAVARRLGHARRRLAGDVARLRADALAARSDREAAALARSAAAAYALEASAFEAAGWLDRGVESPRTAAAFLGLLSDRLFSPPAQAAPGAAAAELAGDGLAAVARSTPTTLGGLWSFLGRRLLRSAAPPLAPVVTPMLRPFGEALGRRTSTFGRAVERAWAGHREALFGRDLDLDRIAAAAVELASSACVLARIDAAASSPGPARPDEHAIAELYLHESGRRCDEALRALSRPNDPDREAVDAGRSVLRHFAAG